MDEQWALLTRSVYTSTQDDRLLRLQLCQSYALEAHKQYILTHEEKWLEEGPLWELAYKLYSLPSTNSDDREDGIGGFLQTANVSRVVALKEWLEEVAGAWEPEPCSIGATDYDSDKQCADKWRCAEALFGLLRRGRLESAVQYLIDSGAPWKAAVLKGGGYDRGVEKRAVWRVAVERLVDSETSWEAAWVGILVGNGQPAARVLRATGRYTWKDALWLACVAIIDRACEQVLSGLNPVVIPVQVFKGIDAPKDSFYYACKSLCSESCSDNSLGSIDERLALHLSLVIGTDAVHADALLTDWILKRQSHIYSLWYITLLSNSDIAAEILGRILLNAADYKSRKTKIFAAQEAGLQDILGPAADYVLDNVGAMRASDLLVWTCPLSAVGHVVLVARGILQQHAKNWLGATAELSRFLSQVPDSVLSPATLDSLADQDEPLVAELASYMHLCRVGNLYKEYCHAAENPPVRNTANDGQFGAAARFSERSEQAWKLRLSTLASSFTESCNELLNNGAWSAECLEGNQIVSRLKSSFCPHLSKALQGIR